MSNVGLHNFVYERNTIGTLPRWKNTLKQALDLFVSHSEIKFYGLTNPDNWQLFSEPRHTDDIDYVNTYRWDEKTNLYGVKVWLLLIENPNMNQYLAVYFPAHESHAVALIDLLKRYTNPGNSFIAGEITLWYTDADSDNNNCIVTSYQVTKFKITKTPAQSWSEAIKIASTNKPS